MKTRLVEQSPRMNQNHRGSTRGKTYRSYLIGCILVCLIWGLLPVMAQPSGGPYGPIRQTYELPKVEGKIYYVAPDGQADTSGETLEQPTTLAAAIERVVTGDAIILRGGTYRTGGLLLNQAITMQPYKDEQPVLKGTAIAKGWRRQRNGLWTINWPHLFPSKPKDWWRPERHGRATPLHRFNNDMVFVDGRFLQSAGWPGEVDDDSYYVDYDKKQVFVSFDPTDRLMEITDVNSAFTQTVRDCHGKKSDGRGPTVRGITFTQYAYRALEIEGNEPEGLSAESEHGKDIVGSTFENCTMSFCSRVAGYFIGDHMVFRHCLVSDTSTEGLYIKSSSDVLLEKNIFRRNNIENITGYYPAAVKIFNQCYRVTCRDNLVIDLPNSNGIWYDVGNVDCRFFNNWCQDIGTLNYMPTGRYYPGHSGFFVEISKGATCTGNVFVNCDQGIRVLNALDVEAYQNTLINSMVFIGRSSRNAVGDHFGWHPSTGPDVDERDGHVFVNNLLYADERFQRHLLVFWQEPSLCERLTQPQVEQLDYNVYVRVGEAASLPLIQWSPAQHDECKEVFVTLEALHKAYSEFAGHSRYFADYNGPLFKSEELGNYELLQAFPGCKTAAPLPGEIREILKGVNKDAVFPGAYKPIP